MKKLTVWTLLCALLLSLGVLTAAAELPEGVSFTQGGYSSESGEFQPVGDITIAWDPDASQKLDVSDGDLSEWAAAGYGVTTIGTENMVYWMKDTTDGAGIPEGWNISAYFVADNDYLYVGFYVTDPNFAYAPVAAGYGGDAIQLAIDFGNKIGDQLEYDPTVYISRPNNIFYSFACVSDGAPLEIQLQESDQDGMLSEAKGDGVKGSASKTETGWCAELALSFDMMFEHYKWKCWDDDAKIYVGSDDLLPLRIGCCLYYLDRSESAGSINWAAGTTNGIVDGAGVPCVSWTAYDNGMNLILPYEEGMSFTSEGIMVIPTFVDNEEPTEVTTEIATEPYTELASEAQTLPPVWDETISPEVEETLRDAAESFDKEAELDAILEKYGCSAVMGMGSLTALMALAAAACVVRKKKSSSDL